MSIKELLESRLRDFDMTLDLSDGSAIQRKVITPVVASVGIDPLTVSTRDYMYARFTELFPDTAVARGSAIDDILISASEVFFEGYRRELAQLKNASSISNVSFLSDDEADALASNWFLTRDTGARASGTVTVVVDRAIPVRISTLGVRFISAEGIEFSPSSDGEISLDALLGNAVGAGRYQFRVNVRAAVEGSAGNVGAGRIVSVRGIPNVASVTNEVGTVGGSNRDTSEYLLGTKLPRAISERSLVTARGIGARINSTVGGTLRYQVIGFGDEEMVRDRVEALAYSAQVATGYIHYMGTHAIITGLSLSGELPASLDVIHALAPDLSSRGVGISAVVVHVEGSPILGASAFTTLVELSEAVSATGLDHISVLRPSGAVLDETLVNGEIGIGGRVDVYLRGQGLQDVAGSALLSNTEFYLSGPSWAALSDTDVELYSLEPFAGDALTMFSSVLLDGHCRTLSSVDFSAPPNANGLFVATCTLYTPLVAEISPGGEWRAVEDIPYRTGKSARLISPTGGEALTSGVAIGSTRVTLAGHSAISAGVKVSDILHVPSIGFRQTIKSVVTATTLELMSPAPQTFWGLPSEIVRPVQKLISPIIDLKATLHDERHPLSLDVQAIRSETRTGLTGRGNILPPLGHVVSELLSQPGDTLFANIPDTVRSFIGFLSEIEVSGDRVNDAAPLSRGYASPVFGQFSFLVGVAGASEVAGTSDSTIYEMRLWCDLLTSDARNTFVLRGDGVSSAETLPYPGEGVLRGDILRIGSGSMSGDYIIDSVIHDDLYIGEEGGSPPLDIGVEVLPNTSAMRRRHTATYGLPTVGVKQRVSIVRIYGQFPKSPIYSLARYINLPATSLSLFAPDIKSINTSPLVAYINGQESMLGGTIDAELLTAFEDGLGAHPIAGTARGWLAGNPVFSFTDMFSQSVHADYEIINPSRSVAEVSLRREGGYVYLGRPSVRNLDISELIGEFQSNAPLRSFTERAHSEITGSAGTYHLDPTREYHSGGEDYTAWGSVASPETHSLDFTAPAALGEYVLEDAYSVSLDVIPMAAPSCLTEHYLREEATLVRYRELPISASVNDLATTPAAAGPLYVFGCPLIPGAADAELITLNTLNIIQAGAYDLMYAIRGEATWNLFIGNLGGAVDGSGTTIEAIYLRYGAIVYTDNAVTAAALVAAHGVLATIVHSGGVVSDEFAMPSLLPSIGHVITVPPSRGLHVAIGEVSAKTDVITVVQTCPLDTGHTAVAGNLLRVSHGGVTEWRHVSGVSGRDIHLSTPLSKGTPPVKNYGICLVDRDSGEIFQVSDTIARSGASALAPPATDLPTTHLHTGGSLRPISAADVGRHIVLWGYTSTELNYTDVLLESPNLDVPASEEEFLATLLPPERKSFGQFEITDVTATYTGFENLVAIEDVVKVKVSGVLSTEVTSARVERGASSRILCNFAITDVGEELVSGEINNVVELSLYDSSLSDYAIVGRHKADPTRYLMQPQGARTYTYRPHSVDQFTTLALVTHADREPNTFRLNNIIPCSEGTSLGVASTRAQVSISDESMHVDGLPGAGYTCQPVDLGLSKSSEEDLLINVAPVDGEILTTLSVSGYFDGAVSQAQSLLSSSSERAICAEGVAKSLHSAYLGIEATYTGGPATQLAEEHIAELVRGLLLREGVINESLIIGTLMGMGATDVQTPVNVYVCYEDNSRRIHKRRVTNTLAQSSLFKSAVTLRTLYVALAPSNERRLGATIKLTRLSDNFNTLGTGGA
jgi:hypothetical protein